MKSGYAAAAAIVLLTFTTVGIAWTTVGTVAYNSEEHKLIADRGVAAVKIPASVKLPDGVKLVDENPATYVAGMANTKNLAVGVATNAQEWNLKAAAVQDNCYWSRPVNSFGQSEYNKKIWIPPVSAAPTSVLTVRGNASSTSSRMFTFGELVAFYGDYRQTPFCDGTNCYVTNDNISEIRFVQQFSNLPLDNTNYCPANMPPGEYISRIASGLVPPFGTAGNVTANTAKGAGDYWDAGWWGDEMLRIAMVNDWHFSDIAVAWYVGMHRLALLYADSARSKPEYWVKSLHYEANALHSLTDLFAFGHVVTNGDRPSYSLIQNSGLADKPVYRAMEHTLLMGGGQRDKNGDLQLDAALQAITGSAPPRNVTQPISSALNLSAFKVAEKVYQDAFNEWGAKVKNLRGDEFTIHGDGQLSTTLQRFPGAVDVAAGAVTASVQSLFDAYDALSKESKSLAEVSASPTFFEALRYLPVYVVSDQNNYFTGRWASYAQFANQLTGEKKQLNKWSSCKVDYVTGWGVAGGVASAVSVEAARKLVPWPSSHDTPCAEY
jgi:hypothetical protein